jgi:hypothetical protein
MYSSARLVTARRKKVCGFDMSSSSHRSVEHFVDGEHPMYACLGYTSQIVFGKSNAVTDTGKWQIANGGHQVCQFETLSSSRAE